jgi:hypothetical protein
VLRGAAAARAAWVDAVAAEQSARYAALVLDAAEAGALLARRLEATGNFSALQRAREEAFVSDASTGLAQARRAPRRTRETLVRALGLDATAATTLTLPDHLPDLPATLASPTATQQSTLEQRLDVRPARARLDELARTLGLARVTGTVDALDVGAERRDRTAQPREHGLTLSLFDTGDATREAARARYDAALERSAAQGVAAAAQLREADGDRRDAHALALAFRDRLVPLQVAIVGQNLLRRNGMLASPFDLLADAREQARTVQLAIAAQRDEWLADAAWQAASPGVPSNNDLAESHHTMNAMSHDVPNMIGVAQKDVVEKIRAPAPGYMAMGGNGMGDMTDMAMMPGPPNTAPMMGGDGPYGSLEMGGMFSVVKVRRDQPAGDYRDPGGYRPPAGTTAWEWTGEPPPAASHAPHNPSNDVEVHAKKPDMGGMHMEHWEPPTTTTHSRRPS